MRISNIVQRMKHIFDNKYTVKENISDEFETIARERAVKKDISDGLKALYIERSISYDQFTKLMALLDTLDTLDMKKLIDIVISEKVGRGIDFLPWMTDDLKKKLCDWTTSYPDQNIPDLKNKIIAALDELAEGKYNDILKDMGCL